jgi:hypothetical protein
VSVDSNPSPQRQWYATGSVSANAARPTRRWRSPIHDGAVRGTWILPYMRSARSSCTIASANAAVANHTFTLMVDVNTRVYGCSPVGSWTRL